MPDSPLTRYTRQRAGIGWWDQPLSQPRQRNPRLSEGEVGRYADWLVKIQETAAARAAAREQFQQENPNPSDDDVRRFWEANSELFPRL